MFGLWKYALLFFAILICTGFIGPGICPDAGAAEMTIQVPSDSTGGGNLRVRVSYPDNVSEYRFDTGAPVVVMSPGGHGPGSLSPNPPMQLYGCVMVTFLYPGGSDGPFSSDGTYDYRGETCVMALRDVLEYALGQRLDIMGNTIHDIVPGTVLTDNTGIVSGSNGGPTTTVTLATHGLEGIKTLVFLESPTNDQTVNSDLGSVRYDCDPGVDGDGNGLFGDDGKNPNYTIYGPSSCTVDYTTLAYDSTVSVTYNDPGYTWPPVSLDGVLFLDNNQTGTLDSTGSPSCYDTNGNGMLDNDEDYPFSAKITFDGEGNLKLFYSTEVTEAIESADIFSGGWPDHIATAAESVAFWTWRDSTLHYETLAAQFPDIRVLYTFSETDHVQAADDHPHIQQAYDGFCRNGLWCRLNPDRVYVADIIGEPLPEGTVDNDANIPVTPGTIKDYAQPDSVNDSVAAVCEMTDRTQYSRWDVNLDHLILEPVLYIVSMMHAEESLPFHSNQDLFDFHADNLVALSDLFVNHGAKLDFGPDWTFIQGVINWQPSLLTDIADAGMGIHTHAHESQYDLGQVNQMLLDAGLAENYVANGGFFETGPGGTNWIGYQASFTDGSGNPRFEVSIGYKDPTTQIPDATAYVFRPSQFGDWHVEDPEGPMIYLGSNMPEEPGGGVLDFAAIGDWIDTKLTELDPGKINTLYWHDSLHNYPNPGAGAARRAEWELILTNYFDPKVAEGSIQWMNFAEMADLYRATEFTPEPACLHTGDVTLDGEVTAGDAQLAFSIALGSTSPSDTEFCAADCNGDGEVTAGDAQTIFALALGAGQCAD